MNHTLDRCIALTENCNNPDTQLLILQQGTHSSFLITPVRTHRNRHLVVAT